MAHARPKVNVSLSGLSPGDEDEVLREAARLLPTPAGSRAIPFVLLRKGDRARPEPHVVALAMPVPVAPLLVLVGHGRQSTVPLEVVVIDGERVVACGIDSNSARFGALTVQSPSSKVGRIDLDGSTLGLKLADKETWWSLEVDVTEEQKQRSLTLARRLGVPLRRYVQVDANTKQFQQVDA